MTYLIFVLLSTFSYGFEPIELERQLKQKEFTKHPTEVNRSTVAYFHKLKKIRVACEIELLNQKPPKNCDSLVQTWAEHIKRPEKEKVLSSLRRIQDIAEDRNKIQKYIDLRNRAPDGINAE